MNGQQMEIRFDSSPAFRPFRRRRRRQLTRARWWFAQMRQVVDCAWDWQSAPAARAEQGSISFSAATGRN